jgi:EF-hand domain pair
MAFDDEGNGVITKAELLKILKANHMASHDAEVARKADTIMAQADKDNDGVITFDEFVIVSKKVRLWLRSYTTNDARQQHLADLVNSMYSSFTSLYRLCYLSVSEHLIPSRSVFKVVDADYCRRTLRTSPHVRCIVSVGIASARTEA